MNWDKFEEMFLLLAAKLDGRHQEEMFTSDQGFAMTALDLLKEVHAGTYKTPEEKNREEREKFKKDYGYYPDEEPPDQDPE